MKGDTSTPQGNLTARAVKERSRASCDRACGHIFRDPTNLPGGEGRGGVGGGGGGPSPDPPRRIRGPTKGAPRYQGRGGFTPPVRESTPPDPPLEGPGAGGRPGGGGPPGTPQNAQKPLKNRFFGGFCNKRGTPFLAKNRHFTSELGTGIWQNRHFLEKCHFFQNPAWGRILALPPGPRPGGSENGGTPRKRGFPFNLSVPEISGTPQKPGFRPAHRKNGAIFRGPDSDFQPKKT